MAWNYETGREEKNPYPASGGSIFSPAPPSFWGRANHEVQIWQAAESKLGRARGWQWAAAEWEVMQAWEGAEMEGSNKPVNLQQKPQPTRAEVDIREYEVLIEQRMRRTVKVPVTADCNAASPKTEARKRAHAVLAGVEWLEFWEEPFEVEVKGPL